MTVNDVNSGAGATARLAVAVGDLARVHARATPDRPAMVFEERVTSYAALDRRTNQVANGLLAAGIRDQARIAVLAKNSDRFYDVYFGAAKANNVIVPVNWRLAPPEIAFIINHSQAKALVIGAEYLPLLDEIGTELTGLELILAVGADGTRHVEFDAWQAGQPHADPGLAHDADMTVMQLYTSGTTGLPKGVELTNGNVVSALAAGLSGALGPWGPEEVVLIPLPLFHVGGAHFGTNAFYHGGCNVILRETSADLILEAFRRHPITRAGFVPSVLLLCLQHPDCPATDFGPLHTITYGGSPIPFDLLRQAIDVFKCGFVHMYGMTESTSLATVLKPEEHDLDNLTRLRSVGRAVPGLAVQIVDANGAEVAPGQVGEIIVRGPCVTKGYWRQPDATAHTIRAGWLHTGDAGYADEDGYLYVYDRVKDMIVSGGENVYPAEVESAIFGHPAVADVAVIGVPDARWGEAVKAVVVLAPGADTSADAIIDFARARIAGFKCPKSVDFVDALPRNPSGKILKRLLREPYWAGYERQVN
ncbi:fatty acid--CoA ligase [Chelatococcus reniformis]|uniref:3-methylmercaptopropionyl-CoA ligase n=1 Tax=Chelatococcus reniformis TaxID=1494448 RepID=A0A916UMW0_9HYPH|nr:fatty acid--CoA ligase [Chelatococcus reniformis]GGC78106.1 acyl-CoA synthetase [Chelatococcus reniformis]